MEKLSQYLKQHGVKQTEFAARCNVTQPVISRLANGSIQPSPSLAKRIENETGGAIRFYEWPAYADFAPQDGTAA